MLGKIVATRNIHLSHSGNGEFKIDVSGLSVGTYFARFQSSTFSDVSRIVKK